MAPAGIGAMRSAGGKSDRVPPAFTQAGETGAAKAVEQRCAAVVYEADPGCCEKRIRRVTGMKALLARGLRVWGARSKGKVIERSVRECLNKGAMPPCISPTPEGCTEGCSVRFVAQLGLDQSFLSNKS